MKSLFVSLCFLFLGAFSIAQFTVPVHQGYVTDYAGVLSVADRLGLEQKIQTIANSGVQIAVVFVPTLSGEAISLVATQIGQEWGVGDDDMDTGIVVLVAVEDRERFVAVGYGLEGTIPDAIAKKIGEKYLPSHFRIGEYALGLSLVLDDIAGYIVADPSIVADYTQEEISDTLGLWFFAVIASLVFLLVVWLSKDTKKGSKRSKTGLWFFFVLAVSFFVASIAIALLFVSFFGLFFLMKSSATLFMGGMGRGGMFGGFGGGGGFGGFGGGGFGGGGAGGRW